MRLRSSLTSVLGAALLAVSVSAAPASAATGQFRYDYLTVEGYEASGFLNNPADDVCVNLPGVGRENPEAGHSPKNRTDKWATVFSEPDCSGDSFRLRPLTGGAGERLKVRSVIFG
ncbi:hypothetical protein [Streptomyces sp. NBC_01789]|uniref:hypothetical protein n=1 Tax=Streptomyces sp. NBC_01789 TaxID=2975941 RepID=UPI00224F264D|nr:hypothetical protein [Streptomyces sp. NBC_01789]MCX4451227.1 hypothetical protein [Streptomyces sp. NBC_01789]